MFRTNQSAALDRAQRELKEAENGLREARRELQASPRHANAKAHEAVRRWAGRVQQATASVSAAKAQMK